MAVTRYELDLDSGLTAEETTRLKALENWEDEYDEDCPELTDEQIKNLKRVNPDRRRA